MPAESPISADRVLYEYLALKEALTSTRGGGRLVWVPAARCEKDGCTGAPTYLRDGLLRCSRCHLKWPEERAIAPATGARRSSGIEYGLQRLGDLVRAVQSPALWQRRCWYIYVAGDVDEAGYPRRGQAPGSQDAVALECARRWPAAMVWNRFLVTAFVRDARRQVEEHLRWAAGLRSKTIRSG